MRKARAGLWAGLIAGWAVSSFAASSRGPAGDKTPAGPLKSGAAMAVSPAVTPLLAQPQALSAAIPALPAAADVAILPGIAAAVTAPQTFSLAFPAERQAQDAARRSAVQAVREAARVSGQAAGDAAGLGESLALAGAAMDGRRLLPGGAAEGPAVAAGPEVFRAGIVRPAREARAAQLEAIAREVRRLRAADPAALDAKDRSALRGIDELGRFLELGRATPRQLAQDEAALESMPDAQVQALTESAYQFLQPRSAAGPVASNWEHVSLQHLRPLDRDAAELAALFKRNPALSGAQFSARLKLLMMVHDLGKVIIPPDMAEALGKAFPDKDGLWYVDTHILPHEYASMHIIERLGADLPVGLRLSRRHVRALQRLIANHNFGADLTKPENASLREHWWPSAFRRDMIPALAALGLPVERLFGRDETGQLQYNHAEGSVYSALLSAYDRAVANKETGYGVSAWLKYSDQDHAGWVKQAQAARASGKLVAQPFFNGPALVAKMEQAAQWSAEEIDALWRALYERHAPAGGFPERYATWARFRNRPERVFRGYRPYADQGNGADKLNIILRWVKASNPEREGNRADIVPAPGTAYYTTLNDSPLGPGGTLFRVTLDGSHEVPRAWVEQLVEGGRWGEPRFAPGTAATLGDNPVELFFGLLKKDRIVKD